jgi:hypothetical protein
MYENQQPHHLHIMVVKEDRSESESEEGGVDSLEQHFK